MTPMDVIKRLFSKHFIVDEDGIDWNYQETVTLDMVDLELANEVRRLVNLDKDEKPV